MRLAKNEDPQSLLRENLKFLITCCQTDLSENDINYIQNSLHMNKSLLALSRAHGVLPLVHKTLQGEAFESHDQLSGFKQAYMGIAMQNILMSAELLRIMELLEANGIEALAFKGPALAQMAYGDITLRQYGDLDILIDEKEIVKAGSVLAEHGYKPAFPIKVLENKICLEVTNDLGFYNDKNGLFIELHWKLFREKIGRHLSFVQISANKQTIKINNRSIPTLSAEMHLAYLSLHGAKHAWERIEWICDIDRLVRSHKDIDWNKVLTIAQEMDTTTSLYLALKLSHTLFQTPLEKSIISMTETERIEDLVAKTLTLLNGNLLESEGYAKYQAIHLYQMDLLDTKFKKLKHLSATYFGVSKNDCQALPLPPSLKFLYLFIKPFRVLAKYIQYGK